MSELGNALGPFATERVYDPQFKELVHGITLRPGMYVTPVSFGAVCAFLSGYDMARSGASLMGFHPWLVMRFNGGNSLVWPALARMVLPDRPGDGTLPEEEWAIREVGRLIEEFLIYRETNGLTRVFRDYSRWLLRRSWYTGPLRQGKPGPG